ncbi:MAG: Sec-independent protein translocase subunit TatA [Rhodanobacteraceae bacterium]|nr:MAG: Sec-independent protein translocase subunit TatA [Rhodanobacteraceae bacterium]
MGLDSVWHWALLLVIAVVIFGTGKLSKMGPDLGNAVRGFKRALHGDEESKAGANPASPELTAEPEPCTPAPNTAPVRDPAAAPK